MSPEAIALLLSLVVALPPSVMILWRRRYLRRPAVSSKPQHHEALLGPEMESVVTQTESEGPLASPVHDGQVAAVNHGFHIHLTSTAAADSAATNSREDIIRYQRGGRF
ncbi:hypothetical protein QBC47DRAFT_395491 [Echria macrotheca]|uniref:Uncharacterized protein n=1 Tax=Echria macrotheca TaxID=438768 RepID=A0AAJ0B3U4_9PEZI|nr:hypothetical protein QBC47DRAFT_395491 [Echria macrotheca]